VVARTLADTGDVARFTDRNRFASWTGTALLDASSGEHIRHKLPRAGNRRMDQVLYVAAISQIRQDRHVPSTRRPPLLPAQALVGVDQRDAAVRDAPGACLAWSIKT
jgi:transposase